MQIEVGKKLYYVHEDPLYPFTHIAKTRCRIKTVRNVIDHQ